MSFAYYAPVKRALRVVLFIAISVLAIACGEKRRGGGGVIRAVCQDGDLRPCMCGDGTTSNQVCADDRYGACMCGNTVADSGTMNNNNPDGNMNGGQDASEQQDSTSPDDDSGMGPQDNGGGPADSGVVTPPDAGMNSNIGDSCTFAPDTCAPTSVCTQDSPTAEPTSCHQAGSAQLGQSCSVNGNNCAVGQGTCANLGFGPRCYTGCNGVDLCPNSPTDICWLIGETWGACDLFQQCDPISPVCPSNRTCSIAASDGTCACIPAGNVQRGQACVPGMNNCAPGQGLCLNVGDGPICYQVCDPATGTPACISGTCTGLTGISWGICY